MGEIRAIQVSRKQKVLGQSITSGQSSRDYLHHQTRNRSHINHATTSAARLTNEALCEIAGHAVLNVVRTCPPPLYRFTVPFDTRSSLLSPCCLLLTFDLVTCDGESSVEPRKTRGKGRGGDRGNRRFHGCIDEASAPDATFPCTGSTPNFRQRLTPTSNPIRSLSLLRNSCQSHRDYFLVSRIYICQGVKPRALK